MFEDLFTDRDKIASYRAAPLFEERLRYLVHCTQVGARRCSLRTIAAHQVNLVHRASCKTAEAAGIIIGGKRGRG